MPRFFIDGTPSESARIVGEDAHHIARSLRMRIGEGITLCDGNGTEYECILEAISDKEVEARVLSSKPSEAEPRVFVTLYQALTKGDKFPTVVQKAVELGVSRIVPILTERCISRPDEKSAASKCEKWQKVAVEAAKQCGRGRIPEILPIIGFNEALADMKDSNLSFMCYEKEEKLSLRELISNSEADIPDGGRIAFMVGSEGGFSDEEAEKAHSSGIPTITLGKRILRTETAPLCVLSALMYAVGALE